ncbi:MAG: NigD-like C-terminal domain-containing protein [Bacteroides sp.]|nr:NigD-like C-terminal domain-containing protein [Bacteroides sp.]
MSKYYSLPFCVLLLSLLSMLTSCGDDDYYYPSVKLEFLTAYSGSDGTFTSILTDEGDTYAVATDASGTVVTPDSIVRIVSYYEVQTDDAGAVEGVKLYSLAKAIAPIPQTADKFEDGVETAPASIRSIWLGYNYLNILLGVKQQGTHTLHFVEDEVTTDDDGQPVVSLLLYHGVTSEVEDYTKTAYLSVPLQQYATDGVEKVTIRFTLYTDDDETSTHEFTYTPSK